MLFDKKRRCCSRCKQWKELEHFHKDKANFHGYSGWCRACWREWGLSKKTPVPCPHCGTEFLRTKSQVYCSLHCALWSRIEVKGPDECWPWVGSCSHGYGGFTFLGEPYKAAREALKELKGDSELHALHSCDNPPCCNPSHLFWGTPKDNSDDKIAKGRHNGPKGDTHGKAVINSAKAKEIKLLLQQGARQKDIAAIFNVKVSVITDIKRGHSWKEA
jgi:hypothetical protein